jgi:hypothetical protein
MSVGQRYPILPIPWIAEHTEMIPAGVLTIGVGHRVLDEATAKAYLDEVGFQREHDDDGGERTYMGRDAGVCIHVLGPGRDGELVEYLRLDCFDDEPHYHYNHRVGADGAVVNNVVDFDPVAQGPMLPWAIGCLRTRLPEMLEHAGAPDVAARLDPAVVRPAIDAVAARASELAKPASGE